MCVCVKGKIPRVKYAKNANRHKLIGDFHLCTLIICILRRTCV